MVEKILNNTTPYGKIRASHEGSLHSSTLISHFSMKFSCEFSCKLCFDTPCNGTPTLIIDRISLKIELRCSY